MTPKISKILLLLGVSLLSFTAFLDVTIVSTALPTIQTSLNMSVIELQWVMNACFLGVSAFMASMGRIADIYGRRRTLYIGTLVFGFASAGAGLSTTGSWLIFFRALQGITIAITIPVSVAIIQTTFSREEVSKAMGFFGGITGAGLALGPVVGGALVSSRFGWPGVFLVNIPVIVIGFIFCLPTVPESRSKTKMSLDYLGILFLVVTTASLVFTLVEINIYPLGSPIIVTGIITCVVSLVLLIIIESKAEFPILAGDLFRNRVFISSLLYFFAAGGGMSIVLFVAPLYLEFILNMTIWMTGVLLFVISFVVMASSPLIGYINHRIGPRNLMIGGALCYVISYLGHLYFQINVQYVLIILSFTFFGLGWAIASQGPAVAIGEAIPEDHLSVAIGALYSFWNIGASVMLAIGVALFHWRTMHSLSKSFVLAHDKIDSNQQQMLERFVSHPDSLNQTVAQLNLAQPGVAVVLKEAFVAGMHAMIFPLLILMVISFIVIITVTKAEKRTSHNREFKQHHGF